MRRVWSEGGWKKKKTEEGKRERSSNTTEIKKYKEKGSESAKTASLTRFLEIRVRKEREWNFS